VYHVDRVEQVLAHQAVRTLEAFNLSGEMSTAYARRGPLLDFWTGVLLVPGAFIVTLQARRQRFFLVASWIWLTLLLGSVMTGGAPSAPRIIGVMPALMIAAALMVEMGWRLTTACWGRRGELLFAAPVAALAVLALVANYRDYFELHVVLEQPAGFYTVLGRTIQRLNGEYRVYLISKEFTTFRYATPRFFTPNLDGDTLGDRPFALPLREIPPEKGVAFMIKTDPVFEKERLDELRRVYPRATEEVATTSRGAPLFTVYRIEHADLIAAAKPPV
jgi:hypothetical protein